MTTYRGFDILPAILGRFMWTDDNDNTHGGFVTEEEAMDSIDAYKREQREKAA